MKLFYKVILITSFVLGDNISIYSQVDSRPNFLFIVVDDLNDYVTPFTNDEPQTQTPNIQQLADSGIIFINAFANAPGCAPSRTSFLSGKDLAYTKVFNNNSYLANFRNNFTNEKGNEVVYTLPEILKDSGAYFTYAVNKIFHNGDLNDFDFTPVPLCEKSRSWNKLFYYESFGSDELADSICNQYKFADNFNWGMVPDSFEFYLADYVAADSAIRFLENVANGKAETCGNPFFLALGIKYPHNNRYVPSSYYLPFYQQDIFGDPFEYSYNNPEGCYPANGVFMPPQPLVEYEDYYNLPEDGIARDLADAGETYESIMNYYDSLNVIPEIDPGLSDDERENIIVETLKANYLLNYLAAISFADAQIGRVVNAIYSHPEIANNTVIILISDHGYSLGEKRHWEKWCLWETDIRIPFIVVLPGSRGGGIVQQPVSLLDIFPTVCDLAHVEYPKFDDGSNYLDGHSFISLTQNTNRKYTTPALSTYVKDVTTSCYKVFSLRDDRFHYILYSENTSGLSADNDCELSDDYVEEELYEIGTNRETDPHEWNNLIGDNSYDPLIQYLQQWLPDSALYLQKAWKPVIESSGLPCLLTRDDTLHLSFRLYDTTGIISALPAGFKIKWSVNFTGQTFTSEQANFPLNTITEKQYVEMGRLIAYLYVYDENEFPVGFDLKYFYINPANEPEASFILQTDSTHVAYITGFNLSGTYNSFWWEFDGIKLCSNELPGPVTYDGLGIHHLTMFIEYGNDCIKSYERIIGSEQTTGSKDEGFFVFPNPADNLIILMGNDNSPFSIRIFDIAGKLVYESEFEGDTRTLAKIDVSKFQPGLYMVEKNNLESTISLTFIVAH